MRNKEIFDEKKEKFTLHAADIAAAVLLAAGAVCVSRTHVNGRTFGGPDMNYVSDFGPGAVLMFVIMTGFFLLLIRLALPGAVRLLKRCADKPAAECSRTEVKKSLLRWGLVGLLSWIPYYLTYYPGGVFTDTFASVSYVLDGFLTNRHPLLYNLLIGFFVKLASLFGGGLTEAFALMSAVQMLAMLAEILWLHAWMRRYFSALFCHAVTGALIFLKFFPIMALSVWKDTVYLMVFLPTLAALIELCLSIERKQLNRRLCLKAAFWLFFSCFWRNNAVFAAVLAVLAVLLVTLKKKFEGKRLLRISLLGSLAAVLIIQGPVYSLIGVSRTDGVELIGIPLQQVAAVAVLDGDMTEEQRERLNEYIPLDTLPQYFKPCLVDDIKWNSGIRLEKFSSDIKGFVKLWLELLVRNPGIYIKEYMLQTCGFWDIDVRFEEGYLLFDVWGNDYGVESEDLFLKWFGWSFKDLTYVKYYTGGGQYFWVLLLGLLFALRLYGTRALPYYALPFGVWLSVMIATPIAISVRYVYPLVIFVPFTLMIPLLLERAVRDGKEAETESEAKAESDAKAEVKAETETVEQSLPAEALVQKEN